MFVAIVLVMIAAALPFRAGEHLPIFSWGRIPLYAHFPKAAGDLTSKEIACLTEYFDFITLEKSQGLRKHGTFESYPELEKALGVPKSDAVDDGWAYTREFTHAPVFVDFETKIAPIDWRLKS